MPSLLRRLISIGPTRKPLLLRGTLILGIVDVSSDFDTDVNTVTDNSDVISGRQFAENIRGRSLQELLAFYLYVGVLGQLDYRS